MENVLLMICVSVLMAGLVSVVMKVFLIPSLCHDDNVVALCRPVCANGYCDQPDTCICYSGWTGDRCRTGKCVYK